MDEIPDQESKQAGHQPIQTDVRAVYITGAVIVGTVVFAYLLITGMMNWLTTAEGGPPASQFTKTDPDWADLQPLQRLRRREAQLLNEYQWVDQPAGMARIPIERAMEIVAETGLPPTLQLPATGPSTPPQGPAESDPAAAPQASNEP